MNEELKNHLRELINAAAKGKKDILPESEIRRVYEGLNSKQIAYSEFENDLLYSAFRYWDDKATFDNMRQDYSPEKFRKIQKALRNAQTTMEQLNEFERSAFLKHINRINWIGNRQSEIRRKLTTDKQIDETTWQLANLQPAQLIETIAWLRTCALACANGSKFKVGHRLTNWHINALVKGLHEIWCGKLGRKFTRSFHKDRSTNSVEPISEAAVFCVSVSAILDSTITSKEIDTAMRTVISEVKAT